MRIYTFCLSAGLAIAVMAMVLFGTAIGAVTPGDAASVTTIDNSPPDTSQPVRIARRAISIPFGIAENLTLTDGGHGVEVIGHGECEQDEGSFKVRVKIRQDGVPTPAKGETEEDCTGEEQPWSAQADVEGKFTFHEGEAEACAHAIVFAPGEGAIVHQWCKEVTLE